VMQLDESAASAWTMVSSLAQANGESTYC